MSEASWCIAQSGIARDGLRQRLVQLSTFRRQDRIRALGRLTQRLSEALHRPQICSGIGHRRE
jgi:hypothetical protein